VAGEGAAYWFARQRLGDARLPFSRSYDPADLARARETMTQAQWLAKNVRFFPAADVPLRVKSVAIVIAQLPSTGKWFVGSEFFTRPQPETYMQSVVWGAPDIPRDRETVEFLVRLIGFLGQRYGFLPAAMPPIG
jgi:hypothetical protein